MASQALIKDFEQFLGPENVFSSEVDRHTYSFDAAVLRPVVPAFVIRPTNVEQLGECVTRLYREGVPMTIRGSGTNLSGGTIPDKTDTVVILTNALNRILEINSNDLYAVVEPGVVTAVRQNRIDVQYDDGTKGHVALYNNFPMNAKGYITNTAQVKAGDKFGKGDLLASSNYTDDKGVMATGTNLRVGWLSWKWGTYEDAVVLS
jgi:glycolate oxidase